MPGQQPKADVASPAISPAWVWGGSGIL